MNTPYGALTQLGTYFAALFCVGLIWVRFEAKAKQAERSSAKLKRAAESGSVTTAV